MNWQIKLLYFVANNVTMAEEEEETEVEDGICPDGM